ncbi:MAG: ATP-binding protein [Bacteroidales bacterium]|nr:ATP-binding protein [Bacteroidales bacterium]
MIDRIIKQNIEKELFKGKAIILIGSRQTGKTTVLREMFPENDETMWMTGDDIGDKSRLENMTTAIFRQFLKGKKILVIDEAQRISDIGLRMKLVTDYIKDVQLIATGSSAFELANHINEPLTGRKWEHRLYPLSFGEMVAHHGLMDEIRLLNHRLIYGYYPEVVTSEGAETKVLKQLTDSYLYKDIFTLGLIKRSDKLVSLLKALAFQIGSQVSYSELAATVGIDSKTVESYIEVLEQAYIVFRLSSFSRNQRNELKHSRKIYFYDNGVRNALINSFNSIEERTDMGALWENFVIAERIKHNEYYDHYCNKYFWRTRTQQEIDYLEEYDGGLHAYEFKWNTRKKAKLPNSFNEAYPDSVFKIITPDNFYEFLLPEQ